MGSFGIKNTVIAPAPQVNTKDYNTIVIVGIAPKGPIQTLTVCASDTDDSQFGKCLTGFGIPRALRTMRDSGAGKAVVINVFDATAHTTAVTLENATVTGQKAKSAFNPTNAVTVQNTPVSGVSGVAATSAQAVTVGGANLDSITSIKVGLVELLAAPVTFNATTSLANTAIAIVAGIHAHAGVSGFDATAGSGGAYSITGAMDATLNGVSPVYTIGGGDTVAIGTNNAFVNGVTPVTAVPSVTYVLNTDYSIDDYGNILFLISIADATVVRLSYRKLNAGAITSSVIIGDVSGDVRTGSMLVDSCKSLLQLVPKHIIIPYYNAIADVQVRMEAIATKYRMRTYYGPAAPGLSLANAISSRGPAGPLATFNMTSKRAVCFSNYVFTYDPQAALVANSTGLTLDDPSAALASFVAWNAAINGPQNSPSNQVMPAVGGAEVNLVHDWEDDNSTAQTNQLRSKGIACIFSEGGSILWGGENASYPSNAAVDSNISVIYVNDIITDALTAFATKYIDRNITNGSILAFVNAANAYYKTLVTQGWIGKNSDVKFIKSRNTDANLALGKITFTRNTFYFVGMKFIGLEENMDVQLPTSN